MLPKSCCFPLICRPHFKINLRIIFQNGFLEFGFKESILPHISIALREVWPFKIYQKKKKIKNKRCEKLSSGGREEEMRRRPFENRNRCPNHTSPRVQGTFSFWTLQADQLSTETCHSDLEEQLLI